MDKLKDLIKSHQQKIALVIGYILVGVLAFGVGRMTAVKYNAPEIRVEQAFTPLSNYTANAPPIQPALSGATEAATANCEGKIKGTTSLIYHLPDGAFYDRITKPIRCFNTEAEAIATGFRASSK